MSRSTDKGTDCTLTSNNTNAAKEEIRLTILANVKLRNISEKHMVIVCAVVGDRKNRHRLL